MLGVHVHVRVVRMWVLLEQVDLQRRLDTEQKRQRELLLQKSKEISSLKRSAAKYVYTVSPPQC